MSSLITVYSSVDGCGLLLENGMFWAQCRVVITTAFALNTEILETPVGASNK